MELRKVIATGLTLALATSLVACTGGTQGNDGNKPQPANATIVEENKNENETDNTVDVTDIEILDGEGSYVEVTELQKWGKIFYDESRWNDDGEKIVQATHYVIAPAYTDEENKPDTPIFKALEEYQSNEVEELDGTRDYLIEMMQYQDDNSITLHEDIVDFMARADEEVYSIVSYDEYYYGGNGFGWYYTGTNIDTKTGKYLQLKDVIEIDDDFAEKLTEIILKDNEAKAEYIEKEEITEGIKEYYLNPGNDFNFYMTNKGVMIYFNVYDLGLPKVVGAFEAFIDYRNSDFTFKGDYFSNYDESVYVEEMIYNYSYQMGGSKVSASVSGLGYDYDYNTINFYIDDESNSIDFSSIYPPIIYILHVNGSQYIYAQNINYDALDSYKYFMIEDGVLYYSDYIPGYIVDMSDPGNIEVDITVEFLGDYYLAYGYCFVNDIGELCSYDLYKFLNPEEYVHFEVEGSDSEDYVFNKIVNTDTLNTEEVNLPEGTVLRLDSFEKNTYSVILKDEAGNLYLFKMYDDNGEWDNEADSYYWKILDAVYE